MLQIEHCTFFILYADTIINNTMLFKWKHFLLFFLFRSFLALSIFVDFLTAQSIVWPWVIEKKANLGIVCNKIRHEKIAHKRNEYPQFNWLFFTAYFIIAKKKLLSALINIFSTKRLWRWLHSHTQMPIENWILRMRSDRQRIKLTKLIFKQCQQIGTDQTMHYFDQCSMHNDDWFYYYFIFDSLAHRCYFFLYFSVSFIVPCWFRSETQVSKNRYSISVAFCCFCAWLYFFHPIVNCEYCVKRETILFFFYSILNQETRIRHIHSQSIQNAFFKSKPLMHWNYY